MRHRIEWEGTHDQEMQERMKACRARCEQYGDPDDEDDCDGDGSCAECTYDMMRALETPESCDRRRDAILALQSPPAKVEP